MHCARRGKKENNGEKSVRAIFVVAAVLKLLTLGSVDHLCRADAAAGQWTRRFAVRCANDLPADVIQAG